MAMDSDMQNSDSALYVEFYDLPIQNEFRSNLEGRPIFEDVTMIKIQVPGDKTTSVVTPAMDHHKARFPFHWQRYINSHTEETKVVGTPLSQWPFLKPSQVEELKYQKFVTVEQLAMASDSLLNGLGLSAGHNPYDLRKRAQSYLDSAKGESIVNERMKEIEELKDAKVAKDAEIAEMKEQIKALMEANADKPRRGRKPMEELQEA